ncbi:hypothetical protein MLD38_011882 [Melastoma candidum]|uniref:Uncharacterized protein n=1 Tax=Melastoma candidum TaxID=119954 RepID=A0ACB9R8N5_9MYRT|nr:hypothetical protein MLD38_011882 [Melastoma candidum]
MVGDLSKPFSLILALICSQRCLFDLEVLKRESMSRRREMRHRVSSWTHVSARFFGAPQEVEDLRSGKSIGELGLGIGLRVMGGTSTIISGARGFPERYIADG